MSEFVNKESEKIKENTTAGMSLELKYKIILAKNNHLIKQLNEIKSLTGLSCSRMEDLPGSYSKMLRGSARYLRVSTLRSGGPHSFL